MTHFVCNQKVENNFFSIPDRESQNTLLHVKGSGRNCPVLNNKVFRCEEFGESAFDFLYGHVFRVYAYIIHTQTTPNRGRVPLYGLSSAMVEKSPTLSNLTTVSNLSRRMSPL